MSNQNQSDQDHKPNFLAIVIGGAVIIVFGLAIHKMPWVRPQMFQALDLDLSRSIINVGLFMVWIGVLTTFFYKPLKDAMDERAHALESTFNEAETLRSDMDALKKGYEERLQKTEAEAREKIQAQIRESQELQRKLAAEGAQRYDDILAKGNADVSAERDRMLLEVQTHVVDLTMKATEKLLGEVVDNDTNRRLVKNFIDNPKVS